jgi:hypothetical protein
MAAESSPQSSAHPPWEKEQDLVDPAAGLLVLVYRRELAARYPGTPPIVHRSFKIQAFAQGRAWENFHTHTRVDATSRIVTVDPFPLDALGALLRQLSIAHVAERQAREDWILAEQARKTSRQKAR